MKYIVGNWKMNQSLREITHFVEQFSGTSQFKCETWIAPQSIHIAPLIAKTSRIKVGSQNSSLYQNGAYTGEISPTAIKELGATFTIIGHSERRAQFKENNMLLGKKVAAAFEAGLDVIYCIGESLEERNDDKTFVVLEEQIREALKGIILSDKNKFIVAYEPVWAIGTGQTATPEQAQEAHHFVRVQLKDSFPTNGEKIPLLYGGSVKPSNIEELLAQEDIDGALVGGASLAAADYIQLCQCASNLI